MENQNERMEVLFTKILELVGTYSIKEIKYMVNEVEDSKFKEKVIVKNKLNKDEAIQVLLECLNSYDNPIQLAEAFEIILKGDIGKDKLLKLIEGELVEVEEEMLCKNIINMIGFNRTMYLVEVYEQLSNLNSNEVI